MAWSTTKTSLLSYITLKYLSPISYQNACIISSYFSKLFAFMTFLYFAQLTSITLIDFTKSNKLLYSVSICIGYLNKN